MRDACAAAAVRHVVSRRVINKGCLDAAMSRARHEPTNSDTSDKKKTKTEEEEDAGTRSVAICVDTMMKQGLPPNLSTTVRSESLQ